MTLIAAVFGAIVGSFLNALSFRIGTGRSALSFKKEQSRSRCMRCNHELSALDLVPIFSYLWLRGRCRYCRARISIQYPLVEAVAALLSVGIYLLNPDPLLFAFWFVVWMELLFCIVYDIRHFIILWGTIFLTAALGALWVFATSGGLWAWLAGPLLALPLFLISLATRGRGMGWGDGGLMLGIGWLLGPTLGLSALMYAFWLGAAVGSVMLWRKKGYTMKSELPFAPFIIGGAIVAYFFHVDLFATLPALFA
jgi:prepilin signal peptidase PulO-like enzyme (type II secretory pathway)